MPRKYHKGLNEIVEEETAKGHSIKSICNLPTVKVSQSLFYTWIDPKSNNYKKTLHEALERGRAKYLYFVEDLFRSKMINRPIARNPETGEIVLPKDIHVTTLIFMAKTKLYRDFFGDYIHNQLSNVEATKDGKLIIDLSAATEEK